MADEDPRPYVYVAMSLTTMDPARRDAMVRIVTDVVAPVANELGYAVLEPSRMTDPGLSVALDPRSIFEQNQQWIEESAAFICLLGDGQSTNLGMELGTAHAKGVPALILTTPAETVSRLVTGMAANYQILSVDGDDIAAARYELRRALSDIATDKRPPRGQGVELLAGERAEVETFLLAYYRFEDSDDASRLSQEDVDELRAQIETLQAQLRAPRGRRRIFVEALRSIRTIAEGAAGSGLFLAVDHVLHVIGH